MTHISNNQRLNAGSSVTLNCSADGNPPPVISWTRVSDNSAVVFPLTNIGLQHEGTYRCTANNSVGSAVTRDVSIVVLCEYFVQLPSWTLFICLELFIFPGKILWVAQESDGRGIVFTHFAWLSRLTLQESTVPCELFEGMWGMNRMLSECFLFNLKRFKIEVTYYLVFSLLLSVRFHIFPKFQDLITDV